MRTIQAKKHLGQHFLKDSALVARILDAVEAQPGERFLEIGPGPATLTKPFSERGFPLTVIEYDRDMVTYLQELTFPSPIEIIHSDFMDLDLRPLLAEQTKVFSNLPYNVSVPITARLLEFSNTIPLMVLMYQKEVAERIRARHDCKDYGPISVVCALYYDIDWHHNVKPGSFSPPPKVQSQILRFRRKAVPLLDLQHLSRFTEVLRFVFNHRRKMISSTLKNWPTGWTSSQALLESASKVGVPATLRPENVTISQYVDWFHAIIGAP